MSWLASAGLFVVLVGLAAAPVAAERASGGSVLILEDEVVDEDLYAAAPTVEIRGTIEGDLVVIADRLTVSGTVNGDIAGFARETVISGSVMGSIRVAGGPVRISGEVTEDVLAFVTAIGVNGTVGRDLTVATGRLDLAGAVVRDLDVWVASTVDLSGDIERDARIAARRLVIEPGASVGGDIRTSAKVTNEESLDGRLFRTRQRVNVQVTAAFLLVRIVLALSFLSAGMVVFFVVPRTTRHALNAGKTRPLRSLMLGVVGLAVPIAAIALVGLLVAFVPATALVPVVVVGMPLGTVAFFALVLALVVAPVPAVSVVAAAVRPAWSPLAAFVVGALVLLGVVLVPFVGPVLGLAAAVFGFGMWVRAAARSRGDVDWALTRPRQPNGTLLPSAPPS